MLKRTEHSMYGSRNPFYGGGGGRGIREIILVAGERGAAPSRLLLIAILS